MHLQIFAFFTFGSFLCFAFGLRAAELRDDHYSQLARAIFQELIEIKTTHDIGTTKAAAAMAARLKAGGFSDQEVQLVGPRPEKMNLVARFRGSGAGKPILFIAHLDVVEAKREDWTYDPFKFIEHEGYFYGRGTSDIKCEVADLVVNFIRLKEQHFQPARDLILALTADEESGGNDNGMKWLVKNRRDLIEAQFCINPDGGGGEIKSGRHLANAVQTAEKVYLSFRLETKNKGGHSSIPVKDNAIYRLAEGLSRLAKFEFPIRVNETIRIYFEHMAEVEKGSLAADMKAVGMQPPDLKAAERLCAALPYYNALLRTTAVATQLSGGHAENALPQTATAIVNCRILPEESPDDIEATIKRVLTDDQIQVTRVEAPEPSPASPVDPPIFGAVEQITNELWLGVRVFPIMSTGATDGVPLRANGIPVYGVSGMFGDVEDVRAHGQNERIGVQSFYEGVEFMHRFMKLLSSR